MKYGRTYIDLFSGAGLLGYGFMQAGFKPILALDLDRHAIATYNLNHPPVGRVGDVSKIPVGIRADLIVAGPPCQGFSTLGRRDPKDKRNKLSLLVYDWAIAADASIAVIENVPPYLESPQFKRLRKKFEQAGYVVESSILNAVDFGVAQRRQRCFVIASKVGPIQIKPPKQKAVPTVRAAFRGLEKLTDDPMHRPWKMTELAQERIRYIPKGGDKRNIMIAAPGLCPPSWTDIGAQATDVWGRMNWDEPANTLRCCFYNPSKGRYIHPSKHRMITLREGARLQGIPDSWDFVGPRTVVCRQIGNGVPVPVASAIAKAVSAYI